MPQLKKVVLAMGNTLIYRDTYEEAVAELSQIGGFAPLVREPPQPGAEPVETTSSPPPRISDQRMETIRGHLSRYRELSAQGRWSEAGQELESIENLVAR